jgi:amino acid transporter
MPNDADNVRFAASGPIRLGQELPVVTRNLRRELSSFEVCLLTLSNASPLFNIFIVGGDVLQQVGTASAGAFLIGLAATIVWVIVYAELASAYPYAGGDYVAVGSILGPWAGFVTLAIGMATLAPAIALEGKFIAQYVSGFTSFLVPNAVAIVTVLAATSIAMLATRTSAVVTGVCLLIEMLTVVLLTARGVDHPARSLGSVLMHPLGPDSAGGLAVVPGATIALGCVTAIYATLGGNGAIFFGEELKEPHRNMGRVVWLSGLIGAVAIAVPVIAVVLSAEDLVTVLHSATPFNAFLSSFASPMLSRAVGACVALALFNAMIAGIMVSARLLLSIGRDGIFPTYTSRLLVGLHQGSGAPRTATLVVCVVSGAFCLAPKHLLVVFVQAPIAYSFSLVCIAVIIGRMRGKTGQTGYWRSPVFPLIPVLGLCLAISFWVVDFLDPEAGRPSILIITAVVGSAFLWYYFVLRRRPDGWRPRLGPY